MKNRRILWVDDDERLRAHVSLLRDKYDFDVVWVRTPEAGFSEINGGHAFDVIVLDFELLPDSSAVDGSDLAAAARQTEHLKDTPIVLLSIKVVAPGEYMKRDDLLHYIPKPIPAQKLAEILNTLIAGGSVDHLL